MIPILNPNLAQDLVELAQAMLGADPVGLAAAAPKVQIVVLGIVQVPEENSLSEGASLVRAYRTMLRYIPPENDERVEVRTEVRVAREIWQGIVDQVREDESDLLLLHWKGFSNSSGKVYGATIDELMFNPPCDIVLARFNSLPPQKQSVLMPIRGGSYSALALRFAANLAKSWQANLTVLHSQERSPVAGPLAARSATPAGDVAGLEDTNELEPGLMQNLNSELPAGTRLVTVYGSPLRRIAGESVSHDLVIIGASALEAGSLQGSETLDVHLAQETNRPLLIIKTHRPLEVFSSIRTTISAKANLVEEVDRWFAENIFHYREFRTMSSLTLLKERNNLSVSLVFPVYGRTLPVTLAETVRRARYILIKDCALVDEIIVAVSSTPLDPTEIKFFEAGVDGTPDPHNQNQGELVFINSTLGKFSNRPTETRLPFSDGPAEALRAALEKARGDIVAWIDPTIPGFEARLVYGLVGPLLTNSTLHFATGFYSESGNENENNAQPFVSNELTELALRPLINSMFPQLSGIIDPLCSVGAVRRELLEKLPFFTGQGFNIGLLIDSLQREGLMSIAQVDLGQLPQIICPVGPQQMLNQVLTVLMRRIEERSQNPLVRYLDPTLKTIRKLGDTFSLQLDAEAELPHELPPLIYTSGYTRHSF